MEAFKYELCKAYRWYKEGFELIQLQNYIAQGKYQQSGLWTAKNF